MLKFTFYWDEDEGMSYDEMLDNLMHLGAYDIDHEEAEPRKPSPETERKPKPGQ